MEEVFLLEEDKPTRTSERRALRWRRGRCWREMEQMARMGLKKQRQGVGGALLAVSPGKGAKISRGHAWQPGCW
jgi:TctA family transporter